MRALPSAAAVLALVLSGCGDAAPAPPPKSPAAGPASTEAAARRLVFESDLEEVLRLAGKGDFAGARARLDALKTAPGADPVRWARALEEVAAREAAARRDGERRDLLAALREKPSPGDTAARAASFEEVASRARDFLARWPDGDPSGEIAAGLEYAAGEGRRFRDFSAALAGARRALEAKEWDAAITAADEALRVLPREEARALRLDAVKGATPRLMVLVPAGSALLGKERRPVPVPSFYIDRTEVTCAAYALFLSGEKAERAPPAGWTGMEPPGGREDHPVAGVSGEDAAAFAAWEGKRLPTEFEWEKAARGTEGRVFPWGDAFDPRNGNFGNGGTAPVGTTPGDFSPFGLLDAGGNVAELTVPVLGFRAPAPGESPPRWVARGGHWAGASIPENNALFLRYPFRAGEKDGATGFRCARDAR